MAESASPRAGHQLADRDLPQADLRPSAEVMKLARMGCSYPTRLSFSRSLIRVLASQAAESPTGLSLERPVWSLDDEGYGRAVYSLDFAGRTYSLVAISSPLDPEQRTDRVIAVAWDAAFVLFDGVPSAADLDRLADNVPRQEMGRLLPTELTLSRANKSVRFFEHVVERLASGNQPDPELLNSVGYLMRTTAVYANGKFGLADRANFAPRALMADPFRAEMLTVWLIRVFTIDLVEHVARQRAPETFVGLDPKLRRHLGIGNATGLGMAPFLVDHPVLVNNWVMAKETALARVRAVASVEPATLERFGDLLARARQHVDQWKVEDSKLTEAQATLSTELDELVAVGHGLAATTKPWDNLIAWSRDRSLECQELLVALLLELYPELVNGLAGCMYAGPGPGLDPTMSLGELRSLLDRDWAWATSIDFDDRQQTTLFWYLSEERREPRIGDRYVEDGADRERPLDIARRVHALHGDLADYVADGSKPDSGGLPRFLMAYPQHRMAVHRVQLSAQHPYGEIQNNLLKNDCRPIDMLRWKLAFFGAAKFDPKSELWTRISLFQGAPCPGDLGPGVEVDQADDWWLPVLEMSQTAPGSPSPGHEQS